MKRVVFSCLEHWILVLLTIGSCCLPFAHASSESLCSSEEKILFTCSIGKKLVSVCSSKELSGASVYVQYKFGKKDSPLELLYPSDKAHPTGKFSYGETGSAHASLENIFFTHADYSYTLYREAASFDTNGSGIRVKTPDGKLVRLKCKEVSPPSSLYELNGLRLRKLPQESLVSSETDELWPNDSPNTDLLQGVRIHDLALITSALQQGADVNFHANNYFTVLGALADGRSNAIRLSRVTEFDEETDRLLVLLLAHGALPTITTTQNGNTAIIPLANAGSIRAVHTLLDTGWPNDYQYRLSVGVLLGDSGLAKESLDHGADPNKPIQGGRVVASAFNAAGRLSSKGNEAKQEQALSLLELLLKAGAKIDYEDIVTAYAYYGQEINIRPVFDMLIRYTTPEIRSKCLSSLKIYINTPYPQRKSNLDWLIKRLEQQ